MFSLFVFWQLFCETNRRDVTRLTGVAGLLEACWWLCTVCAWAGILYSDSISNRHCADSGFKNARSQMLESFTCPCFFYSHEPKVWWLILLNALISFINLNSKILQKSKWKTKWCSRLIHFGEISLQQLKIILSSLHDPHLLVWMPDHIGTCSE